jgi:signal-transduction protein with cAMP-binding, CBS, and nucleotidyltransferase domain
MIKSSALQKYSLFGGLLEEQIDQILPLMEQEDYQAGDNIIVEGQTNDKIRFILNGRVAVVKNHVALVEFNEGDVVFHHRNPTIQDKTDLVIGLALNDDVVSGLVVLLFHQGQNLVDLFFQKTAKERIFLQGGGFYHSYHL